MKKELRDNHASGNLLCFVQFLHPGGEHKPDGDNCITWNKQKKHKRKFLKQKGCYLSKKGKVVADKEIMFWGEWEPQSKVIKKLKNLQNGHPMYIYEPYYNLDEAKKGNLQNTDPFVFGNRFLYGICQQDSKPSLRKLEKGSVIIFGSCKKQKLQNLKIKELWKFVVDTVFVVGNYIDYKFDYKSTKNGLKVLNEPFNLPEDYIIEEYFKISLYHFMKSLKSKKYKKNIKYRLYIGATYEKQYNEMFSYFPCQPYGKGTQGFQRPNIRLDEIKQTQTQGINGTKTAIDIQKAKKLWNDVTNQILNQKLMLGIRAKMPPPEKPA